MLLKPRNQQPGVQLLTAHFLGQIEASQITHYISRQLMKIEMFSPKVTIGKVAHRISIQHHLNQKKA